MYFDINFKAGSSPNIVPNFKKLLSLLSRIELTVGFSNFLGRLRLKRVDALTLTPPREILAELLRRESGDDEAGDAYQVIKKLMEKMEESKSTREEEGARERDRQIRAEEMDGFME